VRPARGPGPARPPASAPRGVLRARNVKARWLEAARHTSAEGGGLRGHAMKDVGRQATDEAGRRGQARGQLEAGELSLLWARPARWWVLLSF